MTLDLQQSVQTLLIGNQSTELLSRFHTLHRLDAVDQYRECLNGKSAFFEKCVDELLL